MYEGDSVLRPDAAIGASLRALFKAPAPTVDFVRSNIPAERANPTVPEIQAIAQTARALRSAAMARLLKSAAASMAHGLKAVHAAVADWFERIEYQERDNFFAASTDLADLEQRQRQWERTGCARY
jgi:hypothetical protein